MNSPLMSNVESEKMERVMCHLENALNPKVIFSENVEEMRKQAEIVRVEEIRAAMRLVYANVAGLNHRPDLSEEIISVPV